MNKNVKKNYIFNLIYQIFLIIIPIITTPYVSRVLLSDGVGKYSFSLSIVNYFTLFAAFGFGFYAQREIAKYNGNKYEQSKVFWEMFILKCITTFVTLLIFVCLIFSGLLKTYNTLLIIFSMSIVSVALDSSYMLQGNEEFKKIVSANLIVRILSILSIFIFVKNPSHVWIYTLINVAGGILSNVILWIYTSKYLVKINIKCLEIKKHFIPALKLFIPTIAASIYTLLDRTLIGLMMPNNIADSSVGFYDSAEKIVKMALTVITSLGTVMLPNNAKYYSQKDYNKVNNNIYGALRFTLCFGIPLMFGLAATSSNIVPWFFGPGYESCIKIIALLSPIVVFIGVSNVLGIQYLVPTNKEKIFTISVTIGAVINLFLNIIMIQEFGVIGAVISTVIAEFCVSLYQIIYLRKTFSIKIIIIQSVKYLISGIIMFIIVSQIAYYMASSIFNTLVLAIIGIVIYFLLLLIFKDKLILESISKIILKIKKLNLRNKELKHIDDVDVVPESAEEDMLDNTDEANEENIVVESEKDLNLENKK